MPATGDTTTRGDRRAAGSTARPRSTLSPDEAGPAGAEEVLPRVFRLEGSPRTWYQNVAASQLWVGRGALSHAGAAALWELEGFRPGNRSRWPRRGTCGSRRLADRAPNRPSGAGGPRTSCSVTTLIEGCSTWGQSPRAAGRGRPRRRPPAPPRLRASSPCLSGAARRAGAAGGGRAPRAARPTRRRRRLREPLRAAAAEAPHNLGPARARTAVGGPRERAERWNGGSCLPGSASGDRGRRLPVSLGGLHGNTTSPVATR